MDPKFNRYKEDLASLIKKGEQLRISMHLQANPDGYKEHYKEKYADFLKKTPNFLNEYQSWYSESLYVVKQIIPDRLDDFKKLYEKPKTHRKQITFENYTIEDALFNLRITNFANETVVDFSSAIPRFVQQLSILKSIERRFESSLFDIKQIVQADLFDSELEAAHELLKNKFVRAAGAMAGVVLEAHLAQVSANHKLSMKKKHPSIIDWNDLLKTSAVIELPDWRRIQYLADLRNLCDHKKENDPTKEEIENLLNGVDRICKNLF